MSLGRPPQSTWKCRFGHPRNNWLEQICQDSGFPPADLWCRTVKCAHGVMLWPRLAACWWWCSCAVVGVIVVTAAAVTVYDWYICSYETSAISVRLGKVVPMSLVRNFDSRRYPMASWKNLCIEGWIWCWLLTALCFSSAWTVAKFILEHL